MIATLLDHGASPDARNNRKETPLHTSSANGLLEVVDLLLQHGAAVDEPNESEWAPLISSTSRTSGHKLEVARSLLQHGADINAITNLGWRVLHIASESEVVELVRFLLENGANVQATAARERIVRDPSGKIITEIVSGETALHWAVDIHMGKSLYVIDALLDHGADIEAKDSNGATPLLRAIMTDGIRPTNEDTVNYLLERETDTHAMDNLERNAAQLANAKGFRISESGKFERKPVPQSARVCQRGWCRGWGVNRGHERGVRGR